MTKPILNGASIVPLVGQRVPASVPQHVGVNFEGEAGALANALDEPIDGIWRERPASLRLEYIAAGGLALELAKSAQLVAAAQTTQTGQFAGGGGRAAGPAVACRARDKGGQF